MNLRLYFSMLSLLFLLTPEPLIYAQTHHYSNAGATMIGKPAKRSIDLQSGKGEPLAYGKIIIKTEPNLEGNAIKRLQVLGDNLQEGKIYWLYVNDVLIASAKALSERSATLEGTAAVEFDFAGNGKIENDLFSLLNYKSQTNHVELRDQDGGIVLWQNFAL